MQIKKLVFVFLSLTLYFNLTLASVSGQLTSNSSLNSQVSDDSQIINAVRNRRNAFFVEGAHLKVFQILPEDHNGLPHQKWMATLSNGSRVMIVYNLDMGEAVPLKVGDEFSVGGQFIWTKKGALVHWTHEDPRKNRPDGYVIYNGRNYGIPSN